MSAGPKNRVETVENFLALLRELLSGGAEPKPAATDEKPRLKVYEVAARYGVDRETVYRWIQQGLMPCLRMPGGDYRFREADLVEFDHRRETNWTPPEAAPEPAPAPSGEKQVVVLRENPGGSMSVVEQDLGKLDEAGQKRLREVLARERSRPRARPTLAGGGAR